MCNVYIAMVTPIHWCNQITDLFGLSLTTKKWRIKRKKKKQNIQDIPFKGESFYNEDDEKDFFKNINIIFC